MTDEVVGNLVGVSDVQRHVTVGTTKNTDRISAGLIYTTTGIDPEFCRNSLDSVSILWHVFIGHFYVAKVRHLVAHASSYGSLTRVMYTRRQSFVSHSQLRPGKEN